MTSDSPPALPEAARTIADKMEAGQMLGAARNVEAIFQILSHVARDDDGRGITRVRKVAEHYLNSRGSETAAVANALITFLDTIPDEAGVGWVDTFARDYGKLQQTSMAKVVAAALEVLADARAILAYDYSSTVERILREWARLDGPRTMLIPESRTLDGGRPYVEALVGAGAKIRFLSDGAMAPMVDQADAVLEGVETLAEDGSFSNTIGSVTAAVCAAHYGTPYYTATSLMKLARGVERGQLTAGDPRNFLDTYGEMEGVDASYVENEWVPAALVSGHITEVGLLEPGAVRAAGTAYFASTSLMTDAGS